MGRFITTYIQSGDIYFERDSSYFASLTKWKTAGADNRYKLTIPTHMGFLWKNLSTNEVYFIEGDPVANCVKVNPISKRTNQPADCPGIMEIWRPSAWKYALYNGQSYPLSQADKNYYQAYYAARAQSELPTYVNQGLYNILSYFGYLFGTTWNTDADWLSSQFCYFFLRKEFWTSFPFIKCRYGRFTYNRVVGYYTDDAGLSISYHCGYAPASSYDWTYYFRGSPQNWLVMNNNPSSYDFKTCYADQGGRTPGLSYNIIPKSLWWQA